MNPLVFGCAAPRGAAPRCSVLGTAHFSTWCFACTRAATHRISGTVIVVLASSQARGCFSRPSSHACARRLWHVTRRLALPYPQSGHAHGAHQCFERHRTGLLRARRVAPVLRLPCSAGGRCPRSRGHPAPGAHTSLAPVPGCVCGMGGRAAACTARRPRCMAAGCCFLCCTVRFATVGALFGCVVPRDGYTMAQSGCVAMLASFPRLAAFLLLISSKAGMRPELLHGCWALIGIGFSFCAARPAQPDCVRGRQA